MSATNIYYVYQYLDPNTKIPFYIGKGKGDRYQSHLRKARTQTKKSYPVIDKCKQLLLESQEPIIEILEYFDNERQACNREIELIAKIGRKDCKAGPLLNLTNGGEGSSGRLWSEERKSKWQGQNNPMYGKVPWKEAGLNNPMTSRNHSDESRQKMSEAIKKSYDDDLRETRRKQMLKNNPSKGKPAKNRRPVTFRGIKFECIKHACEHFGVRKGTVYQEGKF